VGKSVLLGRIARGASADVTVIGLVGERGREVREFIEKDLGPEGLERSVVVVSTGDAPPVMRVQAASVAASVAEYFRERGWEVLLLMDSLTRLAMAQRQIGLVAGEPPASKGYTPSVFNLIPELLERCGRTEAGSITGFFTVLVEGDDMSEPVADAVRASTDGHIYLSRELANRGHWPAVDVLQSVSRAMIDVTDDDHRAAAAEIHRLIALHAEIEDVLRIGAYREGAHPDYDLAVRLMPAIRDFLVQALDEAADFADTRKRLAALHRGIHDAKRRLQARPSAAPAAVA
jgi:FliI/YscN family ATPase